MQLWRDLNMNSNDEFLKALQALPQPKSLFVEYRIYYDDDGNITSCAMIDHPDDTQYLVVTKKEYSEYYRYKIVNNKLKLIDNDPGYRVQLTSSTQGYCVVKNHAGIILESGEEYTDIEYYAAN